MKRSLSNSESNPLLSTRNTQQQQQQPQHYQSTSYQSSSFMSPLPSPALTFENGDEQVKARGESAVVVDSDEERDFAHDLIRSPKMTNPSSPTTHTHTHPHAHTHQPSNMSRRRSTHMRERDRESKSHSHTHKRLTNTGSEPGVDVLKPPAKYLSLDEPVTVTIVDYANDGSGSRVDVPGDKLERWLSSKEGGRPVPPDLSRNAGNGAGGNAAGGNGAGGMGGKAGKGNNKNGKEKGRSVRWINVDGMNFQTLKLLAIKYNLHPLAIEDVLRAGNNPRSKLDFYADCLYLQILVQYINTADESEIQYELAHPHSPRAQAHAHAHAHARGSGPSYLGQAESGTTTTTSASGKKVPGKLKRVMNDLKRSRDEDLHLSLPEGVEGVFQPMSKEEEDDEPMPARNAHRITVDHLSAKYMVPIRRSVLSCFMMRDGTLITMSASPYSGILDPIYERLESPDGLLRRTSDSSMLLQGLLDVAVDVGIELSQAFEAEILKIEASTLVKPQMESVRHLHVISSQLTRVKRTLSPIAHILYTLRDQDTQRALASVLYGSGQSIGADHGLEGKEHNKDSMRSAWHNEKTTGYISKVTKIYLNDVIDHVETILGDLEQSIVTIENVSTFVFNMMTFESNASMERLSLVTVIFLPASFLSSYFGMNFVKFPEIERSVSYFWSITGPVVGIFFVLFCYEWIWNAMKTAGRVLARRRREEMVMTMYESKKRQQRR